MQLAGLGTIKSGSLSPFSYSPHFVPTGAFPRAPPHQRHSKWTCDSDTHVFDVHPPAVIVQQVEKTLNAKYNSSNTNTNTNACVLPVFDVHAPEVIVKQVEEVRLAKHVLVRHNRGDVVVDKVSVDGVAVDDDGDDGDEGAMDDVLHADDALGQGLQLSRLLCALCGW